MHPSKSYSDSTIRRLSVCYIIIIIAGLFGIGYSIYASTTHAISIGGIIAVFLISEFCLLHGLFALLHLRNLSKNK